MIKTNKLILLLSLILVFTLFGCASIPEPSENHRTVLILPLTRSGDSNARLFGNYKIIITVENTTEVVQTVTVNQKTGFKIIDGLPPGKYTIAAQFVNTKANFEGGIKYSGEIIELTDGFLTISPRGLNMTVKRRSSNSSSMTHDLYTVTKEEKNKLLEELKEQDNYALWKVSK